MIMVEKLMFKSARRSVMLATMKDYARGRMGNTRKGEKSFKKKRCK